MSRLGPINELWAYIAKDPEGNEGITGFRDERGYWVPMVMTEERLAKKLAPKAQEIANAAQTPLALIRFTTRTVDSAMLPLPIKDAPDDFPHVEEPDESHPGYIPFESFGVPVMSHSEYIPANGMVVSGAVVGDDVALAIEYFVKGQKLPPIMLTGNQARDLVRLARQAIDTADTEIMARQIEKKEP